MSNDQSNEARASSSLKTVDKAMRILSAFSHDRPELTVGELSRELGFHKSIVSRLVSTLCQHALLQQDPETRRIRVGVGAFRLGAIFASRQQLVTRVTPHLGMLVARIGQSAHAMVLDGNRGLVVATVESPSALRVIMRVGEHRYLHATASGKLLLAFAPDLLDSVLHDPGLPRLTNTTITDPEQLKAELAEIRTQRLAWNNGESNTGAGAIAAPVFDDAGAVVTTISAVYPLTVPSDEQKEEIAAATLATSRQISQSFRQKPQSEP